MVAVGLVFAGSATTLAGGLRIAGVPVGGLTPRQARATLEARSARLANVPVTFLAGRERVSIRPSELGVRPDWRAAVDEASREGDGFAILRGFRRLTLQLDPRDIEPPVRAYDAAVAYEVGRIAARVDRPAVPARLVRHGLAVEAVPGRTGRLLDRAAAARTIVDALASFSRAPVRLPLVRDPPAVTVGSLARNLALARRIVSAPVSVGRGSAAVEISRAQLAAMLELPATGGAAPALGGPAADAFFRRLDREVARPPRDATFAVDGPKVTLVRSRPGLAVDVPRTLASVLAAAERRVRRRALLVETTVPPRRTTAEAKAMGITGLVSSYETFFGGIPNRIHNVQLVAHLIDGTFIPPGATFSFNRTTGARTAAKGFLEAPVIINGELQTALGGGVCQVSTTTFNAAYEAGLPITARTNHALYISHYPLGRDATVDYPDVDLRFVNDTGHWLLLRTFVTDSSLVVALYGTPQHRRIESETSPLEVVAKQRVVKRVDRTLKPGEQVVDDPGEPEMTTWVRRRVYAASGKLLSDQTFYSTYVAAPELVRVGPKAKKKRGKVTTPASARRPATTASG